MYDHWWKCFEQHWEALILQQLTWPVTVTKFFFFFLGGGGYKKSGSSQEHIPLKIQQRTRHAQIHTGRPEYNVAETLVAVTCSQLSAIPYVFRHCDISWFLKLYKVMNRNYKQLRIILSQTVIMKVWLWFSLSLVTIFFFFKSRKYTNTSDHMYVYKHSWCIF